jgi:hypothetical protein
LFLIGSSTFGWISIRSWSFCLDLLSCWDCSCTPPGFSMNSLYIFQMVLWFELRASQLGGRCSTTWAIHLEHFLHSLVFFQVGSCFTLAQPQIITFLQKASWVAGTTGMYHHPWLIDWDRILLTFYLGWSWIAILLISSSLSSWN